MSNVCIIAVCQDTCIGGCYRDQVSWPVVSRNAVLSWVGTGEGIEFSNFMGRFSRVVGYVVVVAVVLVTPFFTSPCALWMTIESVYEDDAFVQKKSINRPGTRADRNWKKLTQEMAY